VLVPGLGTVIRARLVEPGAAAEGGYGRDQLLDPARLPERLTVRNWRPGDRFWPAHTRAPKKVKSLLQERRIGQPGRALWPVAVSGETLVWMRGFPVPQALQPAPEAARALVIEEVPGG
jgi:tRNA(Ile)-lysidine synthase